MRVQVGTRGRLVNIGPIDLDPVSVGAASAWSGSYHILGMSRHYDDYVVTDRVLRLPAIPGFPAAHEYKSLTSKIRASGVTGNIGECIAALFVLRALGAKPRDVAHIQPASPFYDTKLPDYLLRIGHLLPGPFNVMGLAWPEWVPAESKARTTSYQATAARSKAVAQLAEFWARNPTLAGFGLVVTFVYRDELEVRATLLRPVDRDSLCKRLAAGFRNLRDLRGHLDGC